MPDYLRSMIDALCKEIEAIREKSRETATIIRDGELVNQYSYSQKSFIYRFIVDDDLYIRDDTPVEIEIGTIVVKGLVISFSEEHLMIGIDHHLDDRIPIARLIINASFLLERLLDAFRELDSGVAGLSRTMGERMMGERMGGLAAAPVSEATAGSRPQPRCADEPPPAARAADGWRSWQRHHPVPNPAQKQAVDLALKNDILFLWGPPGTGKTATLAQIVAAHVRAGRRVLLVSNTNIAVDVALERVVTLLADMPDFERGLVLRRGPLVKEELRQTYESFVVLEKIVERLAAPLREEERRLSEEKTRHMEEQARLARIQEELRELAELENQLAHHQQAQKRADNLLASFTNTLVELRERERKLSADRQRAAGMGMLRRLLGGVSLARLETQLEQIAAELRQLESRVREVKAERERSMRAIEELRSRLDTLAPRLSSSPRLSTLEASRQDIEHRLKKIDERLSTIASELAQIVSNVRNTCRVLATTVYRTYLDRDIPKPFDVVIIDEASMVILPLVYYVSCLSQKFVVVAGDFRQLPPIVLSEAPEVRQWLKQDIFYANSIPEKVSKKCHPPNFAALDTQYRMRPEICAIVSDLFYPENPLKTGTKPFDERESLPFGAEPFFVVDTSALSPWASVHPGSFSRYNPIHALLVQHLVLRLVQDGYLREDGQSDGALAVITPYTSQAKLIRALLRSHLGRRAAGMVATVHRFQGNEKRTILLDLADATGCNLGWFLRASRLEEDGARLLNVAVSRARHHLVVFADFTWLEAKLRPEHLLARLRDRLLPSARRLEPQTFLGSKVTIFDRATFDSAFARDLAEAKRSIVLLSPLRKQAGINPWMPVLQEAVRRGVTVRLLTRAPSRRSPQAPSVEVDAALRQMGLVVELRQNMQERMVFVDGRILWLLSFDLLAAASQGVALRIEDPTFCGECALRMSAPSQQVNTPAPPTEPLPHPPCPICHGPTVWIAHKNTVRFSCEDPVCGLSNRVCPVPGCGGRLRLRSGRRGRFFGCSNFPRCHYTENAG